MMDMIESTNTSSNLLSNENSNTSIGSALQVIKKKFKDDANGNWRCPVCEIKCDSQHSFTVHIRQHNPTDHSHTCSICGKTLSSASSLDRHMLIHSGERPFKCKICNMAFTTNGNMHRHMRTHGMESAGENDSPDSNNNSRYSKTRKRKTIISNSSEANSENNSDDQSGSSFSPIPRNGNADKVKQSCSDDDDGESDVQDEEESASSADVSLGREIPTHRKKLAKICDNQNINDNNNHRRQLNIKHLSSDFACGSNSVGSNNVKRSDSIHCNQCDNSFSSYALLSTHNCINNNMSKSGSKNGRASLALGFHDLAFTDFSSKKYPLIAKSFCEHNIRKSSSPYHNFECIKCSKSFPCGSALNLHETSHTGETFCHICRCDLGTPLNYLSHQAKHQYQHLLSSVSGMNLSSGGNSSTLDNLSQASNEMVKLSDEESLLREKEQFLAMFQLQNRRVQEQLALVKEAVYEVRSDSDFDCPSYFINAKPCLTKNDKQYRENSILSKVNQRISQKESLPISSSGSLVADKLKLKQHSAEAPLNVPRTLSTQSLLAKINQSSSGIKEIIARSSEETKVVVGHENGDEVTKEAESIDALLQTKPSTTDDMSSNATGKKIEKALDESVDKRIISSPDQHPISSSNDEQSEMETDHNIDDSNGLEKENGEWDSGKDDESGKSSNSSSSFKCDICSITFKTFNALKRHNRNHTKGGHNYVCNLCPYTSLDKSTLVRHLRTHNGERPFQCAICKYAFTTKANCERHVRKRHKKLTKSEIKSAMQLNSDLNSSQSSNHLTIQNISKHNSYKPGILLNSESKSHDHLPSGIEEGSISGSTITFCRYCNIDLKNVKIFRHHMKSLHNISSQKPYSCAMCKMGFSTKNNCIRHATRLHPELRDSFSSIVMVNGSFNGQSQLSYSGGSDMSECDFSNMDNRSLTSHNDFSMRCDKSENSGRTLSTSSILDQHHHSNDSESIGNLARSHSSLAALCKIAGTVSAQILQSHSSHSTQNAEEYDGDDSNGDLIDVCQPLDLASHKSATSNNSSFFEEPQKMITSNKRFFGEEQPLDLALHALDLSVRNHKQKNDSFQNQSLRELRKCSEPLLSAASSLLALQAFVPHKNDLSLLSRIPSKSSPPSSSNSLKKTSPISLKDIPSLTVSKSLSVTNVVSHTSSTASSLHSPSLDVSSNAPGCNDNSIIVNDDQNHLGGKNARNFTCSYCSAQFTLKSNMERHIKRKHPEFARPLGRKSNSPHSLATSSSLSAPSGDLTSLHIKLSVDDSIHSSSVDQKSISPQPMKSISLLSKPTSGNSSKLSNKTRAALRVVLNKKAESTINRLATGSAQSIPSFTEASDDPQSPNLMSNDRLCNEATNLSAEPIENNDETAGDLASLSTLICNTANNSNTLKQFLDKTDEEEDSDEKSINSSDRNYESSISAISDEKNSVDTKPSLIRPENFSNLTSGSHSKKEKSTKLESHPSVPKKRSAYTDSPNSVTCAYCGRKFPWTSSLRRHILTHTGLKPYKCPKCPILFTTKSNCERHFVRKHETDKRIIQAGKLRAEVVAGTVEPLPNNSIVGNSKPFKCNFCPNVFSTQGSLRKHYYLRHWTKTARAKT
ncbi:uncharacterized protein LOC141850590 [Brevipalpus obovatus]|uniref:uncharacterized protein LOC141850590 n=1 Tax=Brevipalpus obovatus TaxID=246614 RepID=UPI003D9E01F2